ncbi:hypothetical protein [Pelagibacterium halotolerans]|uniref:Uncharacterized protein n=1 Tax=Pelagibacterium halotolerans (strain DSM 22347 / JCM 15775 / CGMCC 1.7692 / B2) TaxID=1082931 RepID=G4RB61_PELHB|nr:hypothetical protein [Pelagibacterium halotolerans]AEQ50570.1 hypothetical protein KKY_529 [Pelagibacterium halotolerans B2]QJR19483.1 hypothetical protein HKM20_14170 [Pelagibacterium halotolerans]SDZ90040.1 hypothetical protein SAMN05428936_101459 [Pelagibacterium halotolerans]
MAGKRLACAVVVVTVPMAAGWAQESLTLYLAPGGLEANGADESVPIDMDVTSQTDTVKSATKLWGEPDEHGRMEECGAGPIDFARFGNGVTLHFQNETFVGWLASNTSSASFANGLGVGAPVMDVEAVAGPVETFESTLGYEFAGENLFGIADGQGTKAEIEVLWSGISCVFR